MEDRRIYYCVHPMDTFHINWTVTHPLTKYETLADAIEGARARALEGGREYHVHALPPGHKGDTWIRMATVGPDGITRMAHGA